jgi:hypothetical protein
MANQNTHDKEFDNWKIINVLIVILISISSAILGWCFTAVLDHDKRITVLEVESRFYNNK